MVLLRVLQELAGPRRWRLVLAHFNHQLRGEASQADAVLVRRTARRFKLPCVVERGEVQAFACDHKVSVEMAARELRHRFLARTARRFGIRTVALAHHADDQVESFFLRLLRGAGGEGLAGMKRRGASPADKRIQLVRPLLDLDKEALRAFAREQRIDFHEDASNASLDIQRNRLRHELLPLLRRRYQPALSRVVLRTMSLLGETADLAARQARAWLAAPMRGAFSALHPAVQRAVVLSQLHELGVRADSELVEELRLRPERCVTINPGRYLRRSRQGKLIVEERERTEFKEARWEAALSKPPGRAEFAGAKFNWKVLRGAALPFRQAGREFFDADKVGERIVLRHWQKGDRFQPIGLPKPVKLQDWFINRKVSRARRHALVVATTGTGELFWVEGERITEAFKVTGKTQRRLRWEWRRLS
jgi:tRNA(Ile)-lysidine synthase